MKVIISSLALLFLVGCTSTPKKVEFVSKPIPKTFLNCPKAGDFPDPDTMTNQEIAEFIDSLLKKLKICNINMDKIKEYEKHRDSR